MSFKTISGVQVFKSCFIANDKNMSKQSGALSVSETGQKFLAFRVIAKSSIVITRDLSQERSDSEAPAT